MARGTMGIHLKHGEGIEMREHQFLTATATVDYTYTRVKGISNILMGGSGFFIDHFNAQHGEGIVWIHGYGNMFEVMLGPSESIDIEPGGWVYKDRTVQMETQFQKFFHWVVCQRRTTGVEPVHRPGTCRHPINVSAHADCGIMMTLT